jgi:hypothetical protein
LGEKKSSSLLVVLTASLMGGLGRAR